jgi:hypothetical protein
VQFGPSAGFGAPLDGVVLTDGVGEATVDGELNSGAGPDDDGGVTGVFDALALAPCRPPDALDGCDPLHEYTITRITTSSAPSTIARRRQ